MDHLQLFKLNQTVEEYPFKSSDVTIVFQAVLYSVLTFFGCTLNGCVLWLVYSKRSLRTVTNMWVVSLCISQLLLSTISIPFAVVSTIADSWILGETFCTVFGFYTTSIRTVSIISVAGIALDRYHVISRPFGARIRKSSARIFIALTWWCAIIACIPPLVGISLFRYSPMSHTCGISWSLGGSALVYTVFYILSTFVLSFVMSCFAYKLIYKVTKTQARKRRRPSVAGGLATVITNVNNANKNNNNNSGDSETLDTSQGSRESTQEGNTVPISPARRRLTSIFAHRSLSYSGFYRLSGLLAPSSFLHGSIDSRAAQTIVLVLSVYIITWLPYYVVALYCAATGGSLKGRYLYGNASYAGSQWLEYSVTWLSFSNVIWDPLIYGFFNHNFRNHLKDMPCFRKINDKNYWRKRERRMSSSADEDHMSSRRSRNQNWYDTAEPDNDQTVEEPVTTSTPVGKPSSGHQRQYSRQISSPTARLMPSISVEENKFHSLENQRHYLPQVVILPTHEFHSMTSITPRLHSANSSIAESGSSRTRSREAGNTPSSTRKDLPGLRYLELPVESKHDKIRKVPRYSPVPKEFGIPQPQNSPRRQRHNQFLNYDNRVFELPLTHSRIPPRLSGHTRQHSHTPTVLSPLASNMERVRRKRISSNEALKPEDLVGVVHVL